MKRIACLSLFTALSLAAFTLTGCKGGLSSALGKSHAASSDATPELLVHSTAFAQAHDSFLTSSTLSSRENQVCAIGPDNTVECTEGPGKETFKIPAQVIASGVWHTCFTTKSDNRVVCGSSHPTAIDVVSPINNIPSDIGSIQALAVGAWHACSLNQDGEVNCWGDNSFLQLDVPNDLGKVTAIAAGFAHSCAIRADHGIVKCWGADNLGQIAASKGLREARLIAAGKWNTCVVFDDHRLFCWGRWPKAKVMTKLFSPDLRVKAIAVGTAHACVIKLDDSVDCFGTTEYGATDSPPGLKAKEISAGENHSCARTLEGKIVCWGLFGDSESKHKPVTYSIDANNRIKVEGGESL